MVSSVVSKMAVVVLLSRSAPKGFAFSPCRRSHRWWSSSFRHSASPPLVSPLQRSARNCDAATPSTEEPHQRGHAPGSSPPPKRRDQILRAQKSLAGLMEASRPGLDPSANRFHAPLVYHDGYSSVPDWPPNHTFPMMKFERIAHALLTTTSKTVPTSNLPRPLVRSREDFFRPPDFVDVPIEEWLDLLNNNNNEDGSDRSAQFGHRFLRGNLTREEARTIGFREQTHRPELVERTVLEIAGTVLTARLALQHGIAANLAGGTHHAHPEGGAGYTILNDLAIAADLLTTSSMVPSDGGDGDSPSDFEPPLQKGGNPVPTHGTDALHTDGTRVDRVLVIDCDVHQGDGTAQYSTLWESDQRLFTLSIHCESNYPFRKHNSTYDVGLPDHCSDEDYLAALQESVDRAIAEVRPDLVLYDAGVDVYEHDKLGRLDLSEEGGIRRRDRWVLDRCVSLGIPVAAVVGGGYDRDSLDALGRRHAIVHEECAYVWRKHRLWRKGR
ncbi:unnamed protein product [Pseudo-nitzschia multistriata]|uniref:Histone deacetylase domain-containing protein n=1 Tax=Pseudo-nitzschia multistriata TaxID=183589 RepID=A0A448Z5I2_9STRA|nr:unnamed protein product [Pseudo-nitzschia multistriata]